MSSSLVFNVATSTGTRKLTYRYANPSATVQQVKALATGLVTYGTLYKPVITAVNSAFLVTTTEDEYDLSDE